MSDPIQKPAREVVESALLFGKQLEKVIDLARYVESVENLNQLADEANGRALLARQAEDDANAKRDAALARLREAEARTTAQADKALADAKTEARSIVDMANATAANIRSEANAAADRVREQADRDRAAAKDEAATARAAATDARRAVDAAKAELAGVQAQIDEARAVISKLMGN